MTAGLPLLVFTDIDGTLIDHDTYRWEAAAPALRRLQALGAGVVLASSKTVSEIAQLRDTLGLANWPAIVENGGGILAAGSDSTAQKARYTELRALLSRLPADLRAQFRGFGDMETAGIVDATGLSPAAATRAAQRAYSEPGLWSGTGEDRQRFVEALKEYGVSARAGGRFLTLSFGGTKADRIAEITAQHPARHTVALGDAPNDIEMLEATDFGVVIANPHSPALPPLRGEDQGRIIRTTACGPEGWNTALLDLIARLDLEQERTHHG